MYKIWQDSVESTFKSKNTEIVGKNTAFSNCVCENSHEAENFRKIVFREKKAKVLPNFLLPRNYGMESRKYRR